MEVVLTIATGRPVAGPEDGGTSSVLTVRPLCLTLRLRRSALGDLASAGRASNRARPPEGAEALNPTHQGGAPRP